MLLVGLLNQSEKMTECVKELFEIFINELNELRKGFYFKNKNSLFIYLFILINV